MNDSCPDCGETINAKASRCACGWKRPLKPGAVAPIQRNCEWSDHGVRCGATGTLSSSRGDGGPWYCSKHFFIRLGSVPENREAGLKAVASLYKILARKT